MPLITPKKTRLDTLLVSKGLIQSREKARSLILAGDILVNGERISKAGTFVNPDAVLEVVKRNPFVSRGGLKLQGALEGLGINVKNKIAMDVGASTGGFTDCLLQRGADKVYAIDVGYGQLDWKLRNDPRVILLEKTNIRYLDKNTLGPDINFVTIDVSFISLVKVIPNVVKLITPGSEILALIKPQFEVEKKDVGKGGVVRNKAMHIEVIDKIKEEFHRLGFSVINVIESFPPGPKGNIEYFIYAVSPLDR